VVAKVILGMAMIVGRLEILAVIALLAPAAWRR
jgi:Trk-type K+ transport system membrane component